MAVGVQERVPLYAFEGRFPTEYPSRRSSTTHKTETSFTATSNVLFQYLRRRTVSVTLPLGHRFARTITACQNTAYCAIVVCNFACAGLEHALCSFRVVFQRKCDSSTGNIPKIAAQLIGRGSVTQFRVNPPFLTKTNS